ncbi:MAG: hypothetical protein AB1765_03965, partial [Candidatus Hydrogenedentota bacterium]
MKLNFKDILKETDKREEDTYFEFITCIPSADFDNIEEKSDFRYESDISLTIISRRLTDEEMEIKVKLSVIYSMECSRCFERTNKESILNEVMFYIGNKIELEK